MKITYTITGFKMEGNEIKMVLSNQMVKEKPSATGIFGNVSGFIEQMKMDANKANNPDCIRIPIDDFNTLDFNLGDLISIEIIKEGT